MHTYTDLCLVYPLESWTPVDIVLNSAYTLLTMPVTYQPTNVIHSPLIRYSGTSAYNIRSVRFGGQLESCLVAEIFRATIVLRNSLEFPHFPSLSHRRFSCQARSFCSTVVASWSFLLDREALFTDRFAFWRPPTCVMPTKKILWANKSSHRRLNTGSVFMWTRAHSRL